MRPSPVHPEWKNYPILQFLAKTIQIQLFLLIETEGCGMYIGGDNLNNKEDSTSKR